MDAKVHHLFVFYKVDKEKVSDWFGIADLFRPIHTNNPKLDSAATVIKISRNQALRGYKMQKCKDGLCNKLNINTLHFCILQFAMNGCADCSVASHLKKEKGLP